MSEREENKPCPFCGSTDIKCAIDEWEEYAIYCGGCGARTAKFLVEGEAWKHWNERKEIAALESQLAEKEGGEETNKDFLERVARLHVLAKHATPGPWSSTLLDVPDHIYAHVAVSNKKEEIPAITGSQLKGKNFIEQSLFDANYIAAANPVMIQEMIAELRRLEKEAEWLATWCADTCDYRSGNCDGCAFNEQHICAAENNGSLANTPEAWREAARIAAKKM